MLQNKQGDARKLDQAIKLLKELAPATKQASAFEAREAAILTRAHAAMGKELAIVKDQKKG